MQNISQIFQWKRYLKLYFHLNHLSDILHKSNNLWNLIRFLLARNQLNFWTWTKWAISYRLESVRAMLFSTKLWWDQFHMSNLCSKYFNLKVCLRYFFQSFIFSPNDSPLKIIKCFLFNWKSFFHYQDIQFFVIFSLPFHYFQI